MAGKKGQFEFNIRLRDAKTNEVTYEAVKGYQHKVEGIVFGIYTPERGEWVATEVQTGKQITVEPTLKEARTKLDGMIERHGADTFKQAIERELQQYASFSSEKENSNENQEITEEIEQEDVTATEDTNNVSIEADESTELTEEVESVEMQQKVFNKHHGNAPENAVYIGRGSKWGNPFKIGEHGTREQVVAKYREWINNQPELMNSLHELKDKSLVCYCAPQLCHGDVLIELLQKEGESMKEMQNEAQELQQQIDNDQEQMEQQVSKPLFSINEQEGDLFQTTKDIIVAHCISADAKMGAGIAKQFTELYPDMTQFLQQKSLNVCEAISYHNSDSRTVYNLVTKLNYWDKPTYITMKETLINLRDNMLEEGYNHIAMPTIGCGLDKLEWDKVKELIVDIFKDTDISIDVYFYKPSPKEEPKYDIAFTGHRPDKLHGYDPYADGNRQMLMALRNAIEDKIKKGATTFVSGMALGIDQWAVKILLALKNKYPEIKIIGAIPCKNQDKKWIESSKKEYQELMSKLDEIHYVSEQEYTHSCMDDRNKWMVNNSKEIIAVWNGDESGGTSNCVRDAKNAGRNILVIDPKAFKPTVAQ